MKPSTAGPVAAVAGPPTPTSSPPRSQRQRLSRAAIVEAALVYVDEHGVAALSMRRLGAALGVKAMSLYPYVPSRENLLDAIVERVVDELYADPQVHLAPRGSWEEYLTRLAYGVRRIAFAHPRVFPLVATRPPAAPWVRPPLRSLRWMNSFLDGLLGCGFSDLGAAAAYRAFTSFLLGHLLLDVSTMQVDTSAVADTGSEATSDTSATPDPAVATSEPVPSADDDPLAEYPQLQRLQDQLAEDHSAEEFEQSLHDLLDRVRTF